MNNLLTSPRVKSAPAGKHHDGGGLYLVKSSKDSGKWVLRKTFGGRRREMGLGPYPEVGLATARRLADDARLMIRVGKDPIGDRRKKKSSQSKLLRDIAHAAFEARKAELRDDGAAGRWMSPLEIHILSKLGLTPVTMLNQVDISEALAPIWHEKATTASKALNRLAIVMRYAAAMGLEVDINATQKARALLGKQRHTRKNIPSMQWQEVPAFYASLDETSTVQLALKLLILTGLRSKPIRYARFREISGDTWIVPAANMKALRGKEEDFRVPLSQEAQRIINVAAKSSRNGYLFPAQRKGVTSDASMSRMMERRGLDARPHGFRSSLRTWLAEQTDAPFEVAEVMLAHTPMNSVQRAYQRSDYLDIRRGYLDQWAELMRSQVHSD